MPEHQDFRAQESYAFDVISSRSDLTITLDVSPSELELAFATAGASLCRSVLQAIVTAMVYADPLAD